jgi:ATP-dependent exoDNAse (exonuclease V) beta subunit
LIPVGSEEAPHLFNEELRQEHLNNRIDNLHLLYVAFTRARSTLLVGVRGSKKGDISDWIQRRLHTAWPDSDQTDRFVLGTWQMDASTQMTPPQTLTPSRPINSWQDRLSVRSQAREEWLNRQDPLTEGKLLHRILSRIRFEQDLTPVLQAAQESGQISSEQQEGLSQQIETLFCLPLFGTTVRSAFQAPWQIRTEVSMTHHGQVSRPDRIQFHGPSIWVLDYKRESPHPDHHPQLRSYMDILSLCYPGYLISGALLYIVSGKIMELGSIQMELGSFQSDKTGAR